MLGCEQVQCPHGHYNLGHCCHLLTGSAPAQHAPRSSHNVSGGAARRAASEHGGHAQGKHISNGPIVEATQLQHMQRRLAAAEADAEGARAEALRACQRAEAAAADVARCKALGTRLQVLLLRIELRCLPMYAAMPCRADQPNSQLGLVMTRARRLN